MATKIDWSSDVWNPVWGCSFGCHFCYAKKFARRFGRQVAKWNGLSEEESERLINFQPTFLPKNLSKKFSGSRIFVNSMSDLADWEENWIRLVLERIEEDNREGRIFLFLSKRPKEAYEKFDRVFSDFSIPPYKVWLGVSATNEEELHWRSNYLFGSIHKNKEAFGYFISIEPFLEEIKDENGWLFSYDWVILGAQTNPLKLPKKEWVERLLEKLLSDEHSCRPAVFLKENLSALGIKLKEVPKM
jgi:protein gp37